MVHQDNLVKHLKNLKENESAVKKSRNVNKKQVHKELAVKRKRQVETKQTNYPKVNIYCRLTFLVTPNSKCRLRLLRQERVKDYILLE